MNEHPTITDAFHAATDSGQQHAGPWNPPTPALVPCPACDDPWALAHHRWVFPLTRPLAWQQRCDSCNTVTAHTSDRPLPADLLLVDAHRSKSQALLAAARAVADDAYGIDPLELFAPAAP